MNVVLGVGGGIAAYKAAELSRLLQERGIAVQVVMTASAQMAPARGPLPATRRGGPCWRGPKRPPPSGT